MAILGCSWQNAFTDTLVKVYRITNSIGLIFCFMLSDRGRSGSGLIVANSAVDTLVNVYRITNGSVYQLKTSFTLSPARTTAQVVADAADDTTGLYVNATKPISVFVNVACGKVSHVAPV